MKWIIGILAAVLLGGLIATTLVAVSDSHRNAVQSQQLNVQAKEIRALTTHVDNLGVQVGSISQPSDPLSAYNQICNQQMTNGNTGADQTFYFPCTNSAQTIPQPGG